MSQGPRTSAAAVQHVESGPDPLCELLQLVVFPFADIVLGHDARVEITEILVCVRDMLACLANEDAGGLPTEELIDKR